MPSAPARSAESAFVEHAIEACPFTAVLWRFAIIAFAFLITSLLFSTAHADLAFQFDPLSMSLLVGIAFSMTLAPWIGARLAVLTEALIIDDARATLGLDEAPDNVQEPAHGASPLPQVKFGADAATHNNKTSCPLFSSKPLQIFVQVLLVGLIAASAMPMISGWSMLAGVLVPFAVLACLAGADLSRRLIPDAVILPAIAIAVLFNVFSHTMPWMSLRTCVLSGLGTYVALEAFGFIGALFGSPAGGGDSKLMAFVAAWIGWQGGVFVLAVALAFALFHLRLQRHLHGRGWSKPGFPVAPYIAAAFVVLLPILWSHRALFGALHP